MPLFAMALFAGIPQSTMTFREQLTTRWTASVNPDAPHPEYPRPQFRRKSWVNLNGKWDFAISRTAGRPSRFGSTIVVPFPVESYLSGVQRRVPDGGSVWYRRKFKAPKGDRLLLNFEASDWDTTVWVNGHKVGEHEGGYDPFTFDVTFALKPRGKQELVVRVIDPTDAGPQPRGKQVRKPGSIWYTPTTGIWQTVWLEAVPEGYVKRLVIKPHNSGELEVLVELEVGSTPPTLPLSVTAEGAPPQTVPVGSDTLVGLGVARLRIPSPELWSPEHPKLYKLKITYGHDTVESYFAFREVSVGPDAGGKTRLLLNGKPYFMIGTLDQGFWPDGLYTAPTEKAMQYDLDVTKRLGFNMVRKHVKVEPRTWYAYCDRIGLLVWQDMPSGDGYIGDKDPDLKRTPASAAIFERELAALIDTHFNCPSIVTWVLFNEGWGQYDTVRLAAWVKQRDPSRLLDATTGWADRGVGDMHDIHVYPGPASPEPEASRAAVLGEFGGLGLPTPGHMWQEKAWGYQSFKTRAELTTRFEEIFAKLTKLAAEPGCAAAVYTQTTDVETEANGLMTYDRAVLKLDPKRVRAALANLTARNR
ncbi:MAG: glycoside hydrolase family 2 protein [Fimbriimonadaceae bacterium]